MLFKILVYFLMLIFPNHSRYLSHIWYGNFLEHWLFMYISISLGLFPGWGQRSLSRMMLMLKYLKFILIHLKFLLWLLLSVTMTLVRL